MRKTGTKSPTTTATAVIAALLIVSAAGMGFRQLYREGVFSETQPINLTQSPSQTQSSPQLQSTSRTQPPGQTPSAPQMQPPIQAQPSSRMQTPPGMQPSPQTQSAGPQTAAITEAPRDAVDEDAAFQMWLEGMQAEEFERQMQEIAGEDANVPQETPTPAEQTEPNTAQ